MTNTQKVLKKHEVGGERKGKDKTLPMRAAVVSKVQEMTPRQEGESQARTIISTQPYIAGKDTVQDTAVPYADSALFNAVTRVRSGKSIEPSLEEVYAAALPIYQRDAYIPAEAYAAAAQRVETPKPESGYKRGVSTYREEDDPLIQAVIQMERESNAKKEDDDPFIRAILNTQKESLAEDEDPFIRAIIDTQPYIARKDSAQSTASPYAAAAQRGVGTYREEDDPLIQAVIQIERESKAKKEDDDPFIRAILNTQKESLAEDEDPFIRAIIDTQRSQDAKRSSAAVEYDLDTLNKRYDALRQEAEAWESQAVFQGTPEEMWEWERKAKAKRREAEALLPKIDALQQELDTVKAAEKKEMMERGGYREADLKDIIINSFKRGYLGAEQGKESYKEMMGEEGTRRAEYEELLAGEDYKFVPMHWWEEAISGASSQLGQQLSQAADPSTLALMGGFGSMAAAAGQAGPQVLVPEEVVTVPAALAAGFTAGSAMNNIKIEAGNSYKELLEHGVSENTARAIAGAVGGINGALESLQLDSLLNSFGILKSTGASRKALDVIAEELKRRGIDVANNVTQEVLQEGATIAGTQLGSKMETGEWAYGAGEMAGRLKDTAISSALTFSALNVPGTLRSVRRNLSVGNGITQNGPTTLPTVQNDGVEARTESLLTEENMNRYRAEIDGTFTGDLPIGTEITVGRTPKILQKYGANALELHMTQSVARKIAYPIGYFGGKHNLGLSVLKNLPYQLADPIAILNNPQKNRSGLKSLIVLTEWVDNNGLPIVVPIHLDAQGTIEIQNNIASAFGADYINTLLGQNDENVIYTKDNKDIHQLLSMGRHMPTAMADDVLAKNMLQQG